MNYDTDKWSTKPVQHDIGAQDIGAQDTTGET